jgi:hypothetical protein
MRQTRKLGWRAIAIALAGALTAASPAVTLAMKRASVATTATTYTLIGAGDIASCSSEADSQTAALIQSTPGTAFTAGDSVYPDGSPTYYTNCYAPAWGAFRFRTRPVPGNHDYYNNPGANGYFGYFGHKAGPSGRGYYKYDKGTWRVYALTSECVPTSKCFKNQLAWLKNDLATNPRDCVLAIWHRPRFSTGPHGSSTRMADVFQLLYESGAEMVINGHDHMYERYMPLDGSGNPDPVTGLREFVVGTGGGPLYAFKTESPLIEVRDNTSHGVLRLDLSEGSYTWQFMPAGSGTFSDSGVGTCHSAPPAPPPTA